MPVWDGGVTTVPSYVRDVVEAHVFASAVVCFIFVVHKAAQTLPAELLKFYSVSDCQKKHKRFKFHYLI